MTNKDKPLLFKPEIIDGTFDDVDKVIKEKSTQISLRLEAIIAEEVGYMTATLILKIVY